MKFKELYKSIIEGKYRDDRIKSFTKMAIAQRSGLPEEYGAENRKYTDYAGGLYSRALEHIGDLTHRFGTLHYDGFAFENIKSKVKNAIYRLRRGDYEREVESQIISNGKSKGVSGEDALRDVKEHGKRYAEAHKKVPVYNEIQYHARESAVSLGEWRFDDMLTHLEYIMDAINDGTFMDKANEYNGEEYEV